MRHLILRGGWILALLGGWVSWELAASQAEDRPQTRAPLKGTKPGVLVMKSGQLVEGRLSQNAGGYQVDLPKGSFLVPFDRVHLAAESKQQAYEKLKAAEEMPTPDFQVALARWCMAWKLNQEAMNELRAALAADPGHQEARKMYARLHQIMTPKTAPEEKPAPKTDDGFEPAERESLASLSPELAKQYVTRVQPILINRCGNAGCHGPASDQKFQITHVRRGLNQQTFDNLNNVLGFIDKESPKQSSLLIKPSGSHGRNGRPVFFGRAGEMNREAIEEWVAAVVQEQGGPKAEAKPETVAQTDKPEVESTLYPGAPREPETEAPEPKPVDPQEELLNSIVENEQPDAFDPDEFNRNYGE